VTFTLSPVRAGAHAAGSEPRAHDRAPAQVDAFTLEWGHAGSHARCALRAFQGREFESREELINSIKHYYKERGVLLKIGRQSNRRRVQLRCLASGARDSRRAQVLQRETSTRLTNCPFLVEAFFHKKRSAWCVHKVVEKHNHRDTDGFAENRRLHDSEKQIVRAMASSGASYSSILSYIRLEHGNYRATRKVIENEVLAARAEFLDGRTPIKALVQSLVQEKFVHNVWMNADGVIVGLFFTHEESAKLAQRCLPLCTHVHVRGYKSA